LRHEAKRTLDCLNNTTFTGQFDVVFIQKVDGPCFRFDAVACVPFPAEAELKIQSKGAESGSPIEQYASRIYDVLKEGFGDRISLLHISYTDETSFPIRGRHKSGQTGSFVIGLLLYAKAISRLIDRGPSPEEKKKAAAFRKFWGDKAELRRFPDGSIIECVSWENKGQKVPIYQQIITYVIGQHFSKEVAESTTFIGEEFGQLLCGGLHGNIAFQPVFDGFDVLVKDLRDLTGIPLAMRHISATGATARATAVHLPPTNGTGIMEPTDVVVQFESSGKWPDDLVAIQMTKTSFLIKMGELLKEAKDTELFIRIGLENGENPIMNQVFLDVIYQTGIAFRIRIYHDHEDHLLQTRSRDSTLLRREKQAASVALSAHRRAFVLAPRHSDGIRQLSHRFPLFSPTVRLVKKWFTVHLLSAHVADELLELLVARTFLYPFPWAPPSSIMVGFLRTMQYLAKWDWRVDPLIVDLSGDKSMKSADFQVIRTRFEAVRKTDPAMNQFTMFVATNYDQDRSLWTEGRPAKVVAARITTLAGAVVAAAIEKSTLDREELAVRFPLSFINFKILTSPIFHGVV
jgi:U3 small nucleolar RNA-associated protein 22